MSYQQTFITLRFTGIIYFISSNNILLRAVSFLKLTKISENYKKLMKPLNLLGDTFNI